MIADDGTIKLQQELLDDFMPATLLIRLYRETGCEKYRIALNSTIERIRKYPKNRYGGFFHKEITPHQMWLDGLFMAGILLTSYADAYDAPEFFDEMHHQAMLMRDHIRDGVTGLYYHAWDAEGTQDWANPETGTSTVFWGRAMGWVAVALCEMLDYFPAEHEGRADLENMLRDLLEAAAKYQDSEKGLWYQVVDQPDNPDNWREISCSSLFAYAYHKAVRKGYADKKFCEVADKAFNGIVNVIEFAEEGIVIPEISTGTNVMCSVKEYIDRPRKRNDNHGTGTFVLMCSEFALGY